MFGLHIPPFPMFPPSLLLVCLVISLWLGVYSLSILICIYLPLLLHSAPKELELLILVEMEVEEVKVQ